MGAAESTKRTRLVGRRGVEAAGCGGAGMRTVRQRNPTWALRCPAFPSLKYYSVRVERGERENRGAPCERALAAVFTPLSTYSRHPLVAGIIRSFALAEGLLRRANIRVVIYFFSFNPTYVAGSVRLPVRPFIRLFVHFSGPIEEQDKRGQCQEDRRDTSSKEDETIAEICARMANGIGCL